MLTALLTFLVFVTYNFQQTMQTTTKIGTGCMIPHKDYYD